MKQLEKRHWKGIVCSQKCNSYTFVVLVLLIGPLEGMTKKEQQEVQAYGKRQNQQAISWMSLFSKEVVVPEEDKGKTFDPGEAKEKVISGAIAQTAAGGIVVSPGKKQFIDEDEAFLVRGDAATSEEKSEGISLGKKSCFEERAFETVETKRTLTVALNHYPRREAEIKVCLGHRYPLEGVSEKRERKFYHRADMALCDYFETYQQELHPERWEEVDHWVETSKIPKSLRSGYQLVSRKCLDDDNVKRIDGRAVYRPCWEESLVYSRIRTVRDECTPLRQQGCILKSKRCMNEVSEGCVLWEKTFYCGGRDDLQKADLDSIPSLYLEEDEASGAAFSEVLTKLGVFQEIEREIEGSNASDASAVPLFSGSSYQCSRSVLENVFYDCCDSMKGLATKGGLARCDPEEITLANLKEEGRCHFVGKYEKEIIRGVKKEEIRSYCCFSSKLARLLQEQGRNQLKFGWGDPKQPLCRGLTTEELAQLNFDEIDLSEAFDQLPADENAFEDRLRNFQTKLQSEHETSN